MILMGTASKSIVTVPERSGPRRPDGELAMVTDPMDAHGVIAEGEG